MSKMTLFRYTICSNCSGCAC